MSEKFFFEVYVLFDLCFPAEKIVPANLENNNAVQSDTSRARTTDVSSLAVVKLQTSKNDK